ncbi:HNH endonuclease [Neotabrizicola sp. sgz301269]|uniref:HNH endonuclease n=1 Tax=Neotabrizicola sp. sgz301269 TaxID=3276282 RepID=UPI00376FA784
MSKPSGGWRGQKGTRHQRGYDAAWGRLRLTILARDNHLCQLCLEAGRVTPARTVDHRVPKAQGGTDEPDNLRSICDDHHAAKTTREGHDARGHKAVRIVGPDGYPIEG